jgi:hypothetical protein
MDPPKMIQQLSQQDVSFETACKRIAAIKHRQFVETYGQAAEQGEQAKQGEQVKQGDPIMPSIGQND